MKSVATYVSILVVLLSMLFGSRSESKTFPYPAESDDRTLSPYFFVKSDDPTVDQLPLKSTSARASISGVIADVLVSQVYKNEGKKPLEAIYIFPASTRAAVYGMKMTIGKRIIEAKINKREEARRQYEQARDQGRSASLLEQQRPNVFQMNVANIMPGDRIEVELKYTELLVPTEGIYEFVYPTVVGPRYSNQIAETAPPSEHWVQNPYLHQGESPGYTFDIAVTVAAGLPIKDLTCTSHKVNATYDGPSVAKVALDTSEAHAGNKDYILRYRLAGDRIQSGLLLYEGEKENFFLLMMQPPKRIRKEDIPGREYIFIVDVSGSMHGFPLDISKNLLKDLIGNLRSSDRFNVLLFSGGSSVMAEGSVAATSENVKRAIDLIDRQAGGGGTELLPALKRALKLERSKDYSRTVVIATDGYVTVEEEAFDLIREHLDDANMFAFGIGSSVNRHIIEGMAHVGMGEPFVITKPQDAPSAAERFRKLVQSPVLTGIDLQFTGFNTYDVEPPAIPDVLAERPVIVFGKWRGQPRGKITLSGVSGNGGYKDVIEVGSAKPFKSNAALRYLWARHRITLLSDYNKLRQDEKRIQEVTELGLNYNLLTAYTSFVALDTEVRNKEGKPTTVKLPLPLPEGVSDYAVGNSTLSGAPFPRAAKMAQRTEHSTSAQAPYPKESLARDQEEVKKAKLTWRVGDVVVSGGLDKKAIITFVRARLPEIEKACSGPDRQGKLVLTLSVNPDGTVKTITVKSSDLKEKQKEQCVIDPVKKWQFPASTNNKDVRIEISLVFGP